MELKRSNIRIIDAAEVPTHAVSALLTSRFSFGSLLGLALGLGLALLLESFDSSIKTPEEAQNLLQLPILCVVGQLKGGDKTGEQQGVGLVSLQRPQSQAAEAFKTLCTNLLLGYGETPRSVFLVSSPNPRDGKTTVAANLAISMAQIGRRVLLVDADLRYPSLHQLFDVEAETGLSTLLLQSDLQNIAVAELLNGALHFIPAGPMPPNPLELIGSERMQRFIELARQHYDIVVIDTPPVLAVSDALMLSPHVDGIVAVLRCGGTTRAHAKRTVEQLVELTSGPPMADAHGEYVAHKVLGLAMNFLQRQQPSAYYAYGYNAYYRESPDASPAAASQRIAMAAAKMKAGRRWGGAYRLALARGRHALSQYGLDWGFLSLLVWTPLAFGAVHPLSTAFMQAHIFLLLALWIGCRSPRFGRRAAHPAAEAGRRASAWGAALFALFIALLLFQMLPFGPQTLQWLSPSTHHLYSQFLPHWPGARAPLSLHASATRAGVVACIGYAGLFYFVVDTIRTRQQWRRVAQVIVAVACFMAVLAMAQQLSGTTSIYWLRDTSYSPDFFGPYINRNHGASYLVMALLLGLGLLFSEAPRRPASGADEARRLLQFAEYWIGPRGLRVYALALIAAALCLSLSRGALLSLLAGLTLWALLRRWSTPGPGAWLRWGVALSVLTAVGLWVGVDPLLDRLTAEQIGAEFTPAGRLGLWRATWDMAKPFRCGALALPPIRRCSRSIKPPISTAIFCRLTTTSYTCSPKLAGLAPGCSWAPWRVWGAPSSRAGAAGAILSSAKSRPLPCPPLPRWRCTRWWILTFIFQPMRCCSPCFWRYSMPGCACPGVASRQRQRAMSGLGMRRAAAKWRLPPVESSWRCGSAAAPRAPRSPIYGIRNSGLRRPRTGRNTPLSSVGASVCSAPCAGNRGRKRTGSTSPISTWRGRNGCRWKTPPWPL